MNGGVLGVRLVVGLALLILVAASLWQVGRGKAGNIERIALCVASSGAATTRPDISLTVAGKGGSWVEVQALGVGRGPLTFPS